MINEVYGYSIIICTHKGSKYLEILYNSLINNSDSRLDHEIIIIADDPSWETIKYLQDNRIQYHITNLRCPYKAWNYGASLAQKDWLCFLVEDVYAAKGWDSGLLRWDQGSHNKGVWLSSLVEPNCDPDSPRVIRKDFGISWQDFDKEGFDAFVEKESREELDKEAWFTPFLIHRYWFLKDLGGFPTCEQFAPTVREIFYQKQFNRCKGGCGFDNRIKDICKQKSYHIKNARNSWFYHFMGGGYPCKDKRWYRGGFGKIDD